MKNMKKRAWFLLFLMIILITGCNSANGDNNGNSIDVEVNRPDGNDADKQDAVKHGVDENDADKNDVNEKDADGNVPDVGRDSASDGNFDGGMEDKDAMPVTFDINDLDFTNLRSEVHSLDEIFILDDALFRTGQIRDALDSFANLTEEVKGIIPEETLEEIGNTGWLEQNIGFPNWAIAVEGTLIKQDFQIKLLKLELANKQFQAGEIDRATLDAIQSEFVTAKEKFQLFLDSYHLAD